MIDDVFDEVGLKVEDLHASYGAVEVLRGLNFEVPPKNVSVILGANGAGKTTTLRAICNMCNTTGKVTLGDADITRTSTAEIVRMGMAHVPQGRGTFPELSTLDNLMIGAYTRKDNEVRDDVDRWFEIFPVLSERSNQMAGSLSGGEQQMVAIGRALMSRPRVLLMDEPSMGLAPALVQQNFELIQQIHEEGVAIFMVEQNANMALSIADRGWVLQTGRVVLDDTAEALLANPELRSSYLGES